MTKRTDALDTTEFEQRLERIFHEVALALRAISVTSPAARLAKRLSHPTGELDRPPAAIDSSSRVGYFEGAVPGVRASLGQRDMLEGAGRAQMGTKAVWGAIAEQDRQRHKRETTP